MPLVLGHVMDGDNSCPISEVPSFGCAFLAKKTGGSVVLSGKGAVPMIFEKRLENRSRVAHSSQ